jgi:succinoglycan biosynthesis protein ExoA
MSTDETRHIVESFTRKHGGLQMVDNPSRIVASAMNIGIRCAKGEIIVRVDGHTIIADDYVERCVELLLSTNAANVGGRMVPVGQTPSGQATAIATTHPFGIGGSHFHYSELEEWVDTVYLGSWRKNLFAEIGLFDVEMVKNQDDELNYRMSQQGLKILLSPRIKSTYFNRSDFVGLWRQYYQYGYWKVRVLQKHSSCMRLHHFVPSVFVLSLFVSAVATVFQPRIGVMTASILLVHGMAALGASMHATRPNNRHLLAHVFATFGILHYSYGAGFLVGLFRFALQWGKKGQIPKLESPGFIGALL